MDHLAAILFFAGLLAALATILELMLKANRAEIWAALRGVPAPAPRPAARARAAPPRPRRAAA